MLPWIRKPAISKETLDKSQLHVLLKHKYMFNALKDQRKWIYVELKKEMISSQ